MSYGIYELYTYDYERGHYVCTIFSNQILTTDHGSLGKWSLDIIDLQFSRKQLRYVSLWVARWEEDRRDFRVYSQYLKKNR